MKHIVIVGNGIAGVTAARFIRKMSDHRITIISSESDHFFSRTALMYIYMGHMTYEHTKPYEDWFWSKNRIELIRGYVTSVDTRLRTVLLDGQRPMHFDNLIIASGSKSNKFNWPGQDLTGTQGLYSLADLQEMETRTRDISRAVVVGGGLIGIEMAEMLHSRHIPTTFLVREQRYMDYLFPQEESEMIGKEILRHDIDLRLGTELSEIRGDSGAVTSIQTNHNENIPCEFVGLTAGVSPSIDFLSGSGIETARGVLVDDFFETNIEGIYAIGDCAEFRNASAGHRKIEQLWYTGRRHGKVAADNICGAKVPYDKGIFYNSAKFLTVEYQTYGEVPPVPFTNTETLVWQDLEKRKLIRINFEEGTGKVLGFNLLGVRFRQSVCESWIREGATIDKVVEHLPRAAFDPEFFSRFPKSAASQFKKTRGGHQTSSPVAT